MSTVTLTFNPIDAAVLSSHVQAPGYGAVVTFSGNVRDNARERRVMFLEYEAYALLAERQMHAITKEAEKRWGVNCAIAHRLGRLKIGECSVVVAVASAHRGEAFDACRWLMDTLKATVPIWKKEYFEGGACWIEGPGAVPSGSAFSVQELEGPAPL